MPLHCICISPKITKRKLQVSLNIILIKHFLHASVIFKIYFLSDYVRRFATEDALRETEKKEDSSDSEISDFSDEDEAKDMEL